MEIKIIDKEIHLKELAEIAAHQFGDMVKAVVDIEREIMAVAGELHADEEALLIKAGSSQEDLWGINLYPSLEPGEWIEFNSLINIRPSTGNLSMEVKDADLRRKISSVVEALVEK